MEIIEEKKEFKLNIADYNQNDPVVHMPQTHERDGFYSESDPDTSKGMMKLLKKLGKTVIKNPSIKHKLPSFSKKILAIIWRINY